MDHVACPQSPASVTAKPAQHKGAAATQEHWNVQCSADCEIGSAASVLCCRKPQYLSGCNLKRRPPQDWRGLECRTHVGAADRNQRVRIEAQSRADPCHL